MDGAGKGAAALSSPKGPDPCTPRDWTCAPRPLGVVIPAAAVRQSPPGWRSDEHKNLLVLMEIIGLGNR